MFKQFSESNKMLFKFRQLVPRATKLVVLSHREQTIESANTFFPVMKRIQMMLLCLQVQRMFLRRVQGFFFKQRGGEGGE